MPEKRNQPSSKPATQRRDTDDIAHTADIDRLEAITGGADQPRMVSGDIARKTAQWNASAEEEVDALKVDLQQDNEGRRTQDGTGKIVDELAREHMAGMTESGAELADKGVVSAVPGRNDTSGVLRAHHPNTGVARAQDVVEGNLEEPRDEARTERKVDEGTAA